MFVIFTRLQEQCAWLSMAHAKPVHHPGTWHVKNVVWDHMWLNTPITCLWQGFYGGTAGYKFATGTLLTVQVAPNSYQQVA